MKVIFTNWQPMAVVNMAKQASRANLIKASELLIEKIRESMRQGKSGRLYNFHGRKHVASAPGESPAILNGKLIKALEYRITEKNGEIISSIGFWDGDEPDGYGVLLELGTPKGQMQPRPFLRKTLFDNEEEIRRILSG